MPELPEVETTRKSLAPLLGKTVKSVDVFQKQLRWQVPDNLQILAGFFIKDITRRAKYLILSFASEHCQETHRVIVHLGMSGSLQQREATIQNLKHDHVVFYFDDATVKLSYHDPRRFGAILWHKDYAGKLFDHLAPEPLSDAFSADYLYKTLKKTSRPVKTTIMDQTCVVGVGNIYATESLFLSGIHPQKPSNKISKAKVACLHQHIVAVLTKAISMGGSSLRDFTVENGKTGYFQQTLLVYGREGEPCGSCGTTIKNIKISGRASCFCPKCQRK